MKVNKKESPIENNEARKRDAIKWLSIFADWATIIALLMTTYQLVAV